MSENFRDLVTADAFEPNESLRTAGEKDPALLERWRNELVAVLEQTNATLTRIESDMSAYRAEKLHDPIEFRQRIGEFKSHRSRTVSFKHRIEKRLREINVALKDARSWAHHDTEALKDLCRWLLSEFAADDLEQMEDDVPEHLREWFARLRRQVVGA